MIHHQQILELLDQLESHLKAGGFWSEKHPGQKALQSAAPFCVDTLRFEQWLQFVFLPKMRQLMKSGSFLTIAASLLPVAEESFNSSQEIERELLLTIDRLDRLSIKVVR